MKTVKLISVEANRKRSHYAGPRLAYVVIWRWTSCFHRAHSPLISLSLGPAQLLFSPILGLVHGYYCRFVNGAFLLLPFLSTIVSRQRLASAEKLGPFLPIDIFVIINLISSPKALWSRSRFAGRSV